MNPNASAALLRLLSLLHEIECPQWSVLTPEGGRPELGRFTIQPEQDMGTWADFETYLLTTSRRKKW